MIPLSFSNARSAASVPANVALWCPSRILRCPMLLITNSLRPNTTKLSLLSSDQVMETHTRPRQVYGTRAVQAAIHDVPLLCEVQAARLPFVI